MTSTSRPNIVIFMTDQEQGAVLAPDHPCITPNATRFAAEGVRFPNAFCPTAHCCPSRVTFMTGVYPSRHGVFNNVLNPSAINQGINDGIATFSESLADADYQLAFAGKWHLSALEDPADRGWEELSVFSRKDDSNHAPLASYSDKADEPRERGQVYRPGWGNFTLFDSFVSNTPNGYEDTADYQAVSEGIDSIKRFAATNNPWCVFIGPHGPHDPYVPEQRYVDQYDHDNIALPDSWKDDLADRPGIYRRMRQQFWDQLPEDEHRDAIRHYWAYCTMQDAMFGEVLDAIDATGQADNTLVLRLSDHGDYVGAHGIYLKGVPSFREAYEICAIIRHPNLIANPGRIDDRFITLADFTPTILDLAGIDTATTYTGRSLTPVLTDTATDWDNTFYSQLNGVELGYTQRIVATATHKYVYNGFDFDELYDLESDPTEQNNVTNEAAYTDIKRDLVQRMWRFAAAQDDETILNNYGTVAFAPWGPADALPSHETTPPPKNTR